MFPKEFLLFYLQIISLKYQSTKTENSNNLRNSINNLNNIQLLRNSTNSLFNYSNTNFDGLLQMILGFSNVLYCTTILSQFGCIMLDYILAFTVLGLSSIFMGLFKNLKVVGVICGSVFVGLMRFLCSFLSGCLIWGSYAPEGQSAYAYSLIYNGSYMIPNIIIMAVVVVLPWLPPTTMRCLSAVCS